MKDYYKVYLSITIPSTNIYQNYRQNIVMLELQTHPIFYLFSTLT